MIYVSANIFYRRTFSLDRKSRNREKDLGMAAVRRDRIGVGGVWEEWQGEKVSEMDIRSISSLIFKRKERP